MTYKKKLIEITITTVDGNTVTVTDTAEDQKASLALAEIKGGRFVKVENTLIATSAIVKVEITQLEDAEVERANPYGCEGGGDDTVTVTVEYNEDVLGTFQVAKGTKIEDAQAVVALGEEWCVAHHGLCKWQYKIGDDFYELPEGFVITEDITIIPVCCR